jgi:cytochrome c peroxidase
MKPWLALSLLAGACAVPATPIAAPEEVPSTELAAASEAAPALVVEGVRPAVLGGMVEFTPQEVEKLLTLSPLPDPPPDPTNSVYEDARAARLGQALFFDARLSVNGAVSCSTCHDPARHFVDGKLQGEALGVVPRHTMPLWNVAHNRWFFWDGRADSLWAQALGPLEDPREHGTSRTAIAHVVQSDPNLARAYRAVFGELPALGDVRRFPDAARPVLEDPEHPLSVAWGAMRRADREAVERVFANVGKAIAAYERQLLSRRSAFDEFVAGVRAADASRQAALDEDARRGLKLFLGKARCVLCHSGPNFTDREFHNTRVPASEGGTSTDPGRWRGIELVQANPFNGMGRHSDAPDGAAREKVAFLRRNPHNYAEFKTPSLRNVALTPPYMHEGQLATLQEVMHFYSTLERQQLSPTKRRDPLLVPVALTDEESADLVRFLGALSDVAIDPALLAPPGTPFLP